MSAVYPICHHCGRPIIGQGHYSGGLAWHWECTLPPAPPDGQPMPTRRPFQPLTEEDVRRIVREELGRITP